MENVILNNQKQCPVIGIGTFMLTPADAENSVREALKMGYSLVDTANAYVNERACGRGIKACGLNVKTSICRRSCGLRNMKIPMPSMKH